ncbi:MAG: tyrosine-protein phosphatase [Erysipelotrichaceae bacterium]|nr:tyrosine-protein phosphatase [Erysipelotrichaceae bacterium]
MFYTFEKIINVRDFSEIKTQEGRSIKPKALVRTATLTDASEGDKQRLVDEFKLHAIVDLRSDEEVERAPDPTIEGAQYHHLSVFAREEDIKPEEREAHEKEMAMFKSDVMEAFKRLYIRMAKDDCAANTYRAFFKVVLEAKGECVLWHCTQGKDRTGMAGMLLLSALGCDRSTVIDEYMLTNVDSQYRLDLIYGKVDQATYEHLEQINLVYRANAEGYVRTIEEKYGSLVNYVRDCLGISDEEIALLKEYYLV